MDRMMLVRERVDRILSDMKDPAWRQAAATHLSGVSSCCALLALRRGLDPEIASISGLLHDIYAYRVGSYEWHSQNGADMVRVLIRRLGCFDEAEKQVIQSAVFHHANKDLVHDAYDEVLKDADVLQPFLADGGARVHRLAKPRLERVARELCLDLDVDSIETPDDAEPATIREVGHRRGLLADIAEKLASRPITGDRSDPDYMHLIRYWPEEEAFEELKDGWCAAFVFHCCHEAGFSFPIRWRPNDPWRFACVAAWNSWAREETTGFFIPDAPHTVPERGDIVLYRDSIPPEDKPANQRDVPIDHIGIVLGCEGDHFTVAEGNAGNRNVSRIGKRPLHDKIEGYVRIDDSFVYTGWKDDYKSGNERIVPYR